MALEFQEGTNSELTTYFAEVILPLPLPKAFTYRIPTDLEEELRPGTRVVVQFGKRRILTGIVEGIHSTPPKDYQAKYILESLDAVPSINQHQLDLFRWIAEYYMCHIGDVLAAALPSGLKLNSESRIQLNPDYEFEYDHSEAEMAVLNTLTHADSLKYSDVEKITNQKSSYGLIKSLVQKGAVIVFEEIKEKYKPKTVNYLKLSNAFLTERSLELLMTSLERKPKQLDAVLAYLQKVPVFESKHMNEEGIEKKALETLGASPSSIKTLIKNGVFHDFKKVISRFPSLHLEELSEVELSKAQSKSEEEILNGFEAKKPVLLHGLTGSGKTMIYIDLIKKTIEAGNQALYLLPEIALTTQIVMRLREYFGDRLAVYHSKYSDNERVEVWHGLQDDKFDVIIGVRSSIFLPFDNLGLVIVDEEHESSYKQHDPAPRYNAHDVALVLAKMHHANILLGSATPALESYYNALEGNWHLVELNERYGDASLPDIEIVEKKIPMHLDKTGFSETLVKTLKDNHSKEEQSILFQNRRGYAPVMICDECGHVLQCQHCDVSLTYHQYRNELRCHYCGYIEKIINRCQQCHSDKLSIIGHGTEKIEEDLSIMIPEAAIARMDYDTTRKKKSHESIIEDFEKGDTDVLIGTQMVSKGLDFDNVSLVGIFDADSIIHFPDFRAPENAFQLIMQVSGRAGRREKTGKVLIQTRDRLQPIFNYILEHDYKGFYDKEIVERKNYLYPPFYRLLKVTIKNSDRETAFKASQQFAKLLKLKLSNKRVLGPEPPLVGKIRDKFLFQVLIKLERENLDLGAAKKFIQLKLEEVKYDRNFKGTTLVIDVDPL